jgi:hypothetical protein
MIWGILLVASWLCWLSQSSLIGLLFFATLFALTCTTLVAFFALTSVCIMGLRGSYDFDLLNLNFLLLSSSRVKLGH